MTDRIPRLRPAGLLALTILSAQVATPAGAAAIRAESRGPLAFGGGSSVTIPRGAPVVSDPVDLELFGK